ncbi:MAG: BON domain-containing protein [Halioglobus sp.]
MRLVFSLVIACNLLALTGCGSLLASMRAGPIEDKPNERTLARIIEDDNIETKITVNLPATNEAYAQSHLVVVSYNGYVLLAGQVNDEILKATATTVTRKVHGVRRIYNELEIGPPTSAMTRTHDAWITTKIKSMLLGDSDVKGSSVKVVTENGVVYLMGLVTQKEAGHIADMASGVSGVRRVVRLFETVN